MTSTNDAGDEPSGIHDQSVDFSSPPTRKEFVFDRILHAITGDNAPSASCIPHVHSLLPRHHHQGHRLDSISSTTHHDESSNHACSINTCSPHCSLRQRQQDGQQQKQQEESLGSSHQPQTSSSSVFASFSHLVASTFQLNAHDKDSNNDNNNNTDSTDEKKSRPFFNFAFHSRRRSRSPDKRSTVRTNTNTTTRCTADPLLYGTSNHDQHEAVIITALHVCALYRRGYDMSKMNHCSEGDFDASDVDCTSTDGEGGGDTRKDEEHGHDHSNFDHRARHALRSLGFEFRLDACQKCCRKHDSVESSNYCNGDNEFEYNRCKNCVTRLYHIPSNTAVSKDNRKRFIADGKMYDAIADVCQEAAQEIMAETCDLVWVTVCDGCGGDKNGHCGNIAIQNPIKALVGRKQHGVDDDRRPHDTFLISTGNGKVRAGIFSRYHLLTTGLEQSTALPLLFEARSRGMNCVVIDPNARGDGFDVSIRRLFEEKSSEQAKGDEQRDRTRRRTRGIIPADDANGSVFVLAHSAAGGQLVRYLLKQQEKDAPFLPRIRCIAFTDSTHSVQWVKNHPNISSLIQSSRSLYVRSANPMRDDDWENAAPGDECPRDHWWSHRFGSIRTVWAGTTEHSLSNWTSHKIIWDHVDKVRRQAAVEDAASDTNT